MIKNLKKYENKNIKKYIYRMLCRLEKNRKIEKII